MKAVRSAFAGQQRFSSFGLAASKEAHAARCLHFSGILQVLTVLVFSRCAAARGKVFLASCEFSVQSPQELKTCALQRERTLLSSGFCERPLIGFLAEPALLVFRFSTERRSSRENALCSAPVSLKEVFSAFAGKQRFSSFCLAASKEAPAARCLPFSGMLRFLTVLVLSKCAAARGMGILSSC